MKSNNAIYSFFVLLALLFWNPLSFYLIYGDTPIYSSPVMHTIFWTAFVAGILVIFLIQRNTFSEKLRNLVLAVSVAGIFFSALFLLDGLLGLLSGGAEAQDQKNAGIIFEPGSTAEFKTTEFEFVVDANNLGLRDNNIDLDKGDKFRILAFGDSWTMGWGVTLENSWPKKLEKYLRTNGYENVEVINCGQGGAYTSRYRAYMEKAVPLLNPDLVLVGVLQLDDLAQLYEDELKLSAPSEPAGILANARMAIKRSIWGFLKHSFKNILSKRAAIDVKSNWAEWARSTIDGLTDFQRRRFYTLDETVQNLFETGNLNPGILLEHLRFSERVTVFNNPDNSATKYSIQAMKDDFTEMKRIAEKSSSRIAFINLPTHTFTGHTVVNSPNDILNSYFQANNKVDSMYRLIAGELALPYVELTDHFIGLENKSEYFFKYDGHPNERGYAEIANYIGRQLIEQNVVAGNEK